jgi:hypothetical protein
MGFYPPLAVGKQSDSLLLEKNKYDQDLDASRSFLAI